MAPGLDSSDQTVDLVYPCPNATFPTKIPLIVYLHGDGAGNERLMDRYGPLFDRIASFGYAITAPRSCNMGCKDKQNQKNLPFDPPHFGLYYKQQLKVIDWAKGEAVSGKGIFGSLNLTNGVGIAGHSMGGQGTVFSSSMGNASAHDIRAAVIHHAFTHTYPAPQIPFLAFTGTLDELAPARMTHKFFEAARADLPRGLVNRLDTDHHEPELDHNPLLAQFTAAWFKVYLEGTPQAFGIDFDAMLYGSGPDSVCGGGDGGVKECTLLRGSKTEDAPGAMFTV